MSSWDSPEASAAMAGGDFVSFKEPTTVVGTWLSIDFNGGTDFNGNVCPLAKIETDDGEIRQITCGQANLRKKLFEARPETGDRVAIAWDGTTEKVDKGDMKIFTVEVKRSEQVAAEKPSSLL